MTSHRMYATQAITRWNHWMTCPFSDFLQNLYLLCNYHLMYKDTIGHIWMYLTRTILIIKAYSVCKVQLYIVYIYISLFYSSMATVCNTASHWDWKKLSTTLMEITCFDNCFSGANSRLRWKIRHRNIYKLFSSLHSWMWTECENETKQNHTHHNQDEKESRYAQDRNERNGHNMNSRVYK